MVERTQLPHGFRAPEEFHANEAGRGSDYQLLPFSFDRFDTTRYILSNAAGEYYLLPRAELVRLVDGGLEYTSDVYRDLRARHFLYDSDSDVAFDLLSAKIRRKQNRMRQFTGLHIFVVTLRCDHSCPYCQVSRRTKDAAKYDMDENTARAALNVVFKSPSRDIKIEFQGGEPLLNFTLIRFITEEAERINEYERRNLQFVIATNLSLLTNEILDYCERHHIVFSTSLDGPVDLHNKNRPKPGRDSYQKARSGIEQIRERLGPDYVSALMTTTDRSLDRPKDIIDEYIDAGFNSVFLRPLSPYGFAVRTHQIERYNFDRFFAFYQEAMEYILDLNKSGVPFTEQYSALILQKILSGVPTGYVDLQSPAGMGISVLVYNYDGGVYATDEGRMLAEMGDETFRLGDLKNQSYEAILMNPILHRALDESLAEGAPQCYECSFRAYCGSDPTYHYATQRDFIGHKAFSAFCSRTQNVVRYLLHRVEDVPEDRDILLSWIQS